MKFCLHFLIFSLFFLLAAGCEQRVQPFYNPANVPIPQSLSFVPIEKIGDTIKRAGASQNWKMIDKGVGEIEGILNIRTHKAIVRIDYSPISYSITYISSINLLDNGIGIHRNYNNWTRDLEAAINVNLLTLATATKNETLSAEDKAMLEAWRQAEKSSDPVVLQDFLDKYGDGPFTTTVQKRLNESAQIRTGGFRKFDPTGRWQVSVTYKGGSANSSWCSRDNTWNFVLDLEKGKIKQTVWKGRHALYISGENSEDYVDLQFDNPTGGGQWKWTERFQLDADEKRLTMTSAGGAPSGCTGTLGVYMKKMDAVSGVPDRTKDVAYANAFDPIGLWRVAASYERGSGNLSNCPKNNSWNFVLDLHRGKISSTYWNSGSPLFVSGEVSNEFVDLKFDVPYSAGEWKWQDRFVLNRSEKRFIATTTGGCPGTLGIYMKKE